MTIEVPAPIDGKVISILVQVGDEIEEDEPILMIEALKMEMPVNSPTDGKIQEICVKEGQEVKSDTILAIIQE